MDKLIITNTVKNLLSFMWTLKQYRAYSVFHWAWKIPVFEQVFSIKIFNRVHIIMAVHELVRNHVSTKSHQLKFVLWTQSSFLKTDCIIWFVYKDVLDGFSRLLIVLSPTIFNGTLLESHQNNVVINITLTVTFSTMAGFRNSRSLNISTIFS